MHGALATRLAMHFASFAASDFDAFDPIVELGQAEREMSGFREGEGVQIVGGGRLVDGRWDGHCRRRGVGGTALLVPGAFGGPSSRRKSSEGVQDRDTMPRDTKGIHVSALYESNPSCTPLVIRSRSDVWK